MRALSSMLLALLLGSGAAWAQDGEDGHVDAEDETLVDEGAADAEAGEAAPPDDKRAGGAPRPAFGNAHPEGEYGGVTPGKAGAKKKAAPAKKKAERGPQVAWVGFQPLGGGGARVFLQVRGTIDYEQSLSGDVLIVRLPGAKLSHVRAKRFIDTSFFATRVVRIEAKAMKGRKGGVELRVSLKKGAGEKAAARLETGEDGEQYLFLEFSPVGG